VASQNAGLPSSQFLDAFTWPAVVSRLSAAAATNMSDEDLGSCIPLVSEVAMGEPLAVGAPDGFGRYGAVAVGGRGLICHECGQAHRHLGLHVYRAHGLRAADYRKRHGLSRGRGLVADDLREVIQANAVARMNQATGQGFIRSRNPAAATRARLANWEGFAPQTLTEQAARTAKLGRASRRPLVVRCEGCGVAFCPLTAAKRRRFCTRSCASRTTALRRSQ
jgi:hypothetical protein